MIGDPSNCAEAFRSSSNNGVPRGGHRNLCSRTTGYLFATTTSTIAATGIPHDNPSFSSSFITRPVADHRSSCSTVNRRRSDRRARHPCESNHVIPSFSDSSIARNKSDQIPLVFCAFAPPRFFWRYSHRSQCHHATSPSNTRDAIGSFSLSLLFSRPNTAWGELLLLIICTGGENADPRLLFSCRVFFSSPAIGPHHVTSRHVAFPFDLPRRISESSSAFRFQEDLSISTSTLTTYRTGTDRTRITIP